MNKNSESTEEVCIAILKPFDAIVKQDIDDLITQARAERRTLEYKQALPNLGLDQDKVEFLADVCSFANASGGDILYGVIDKRENGKPTGIPDSAPGVTDPNLDAVIRRMEQMARSNIDPKVPGFQMRPLPGFASGPVVLARIPKSYISPHMVRNDKGWGRFYARGSNGKDILDAGEVRAAFAISENLPTRIREFRVGRVAAILAGEAPVTLRNVPKVILHVLPFQSLDPLGRFNVSIEPRRSSLLPLFTNRADTRYNFDGLLYYEWDQTRDDAFTYVQLFRTGAIEAAESRILTATETRGKTIPAKMLEEHLIKALGSYALVLKEYGVLTPLVVMVTLLGVKGYHVVHINQSYRELIDRDNLFLPDTLIEDYADDVALKLKPAFDAIWQAGDWERCFNYDDKGNRIGPTR